ncbi:alpha/beta-hydrolase [Fistulina hepatica ATCC 64428]|nr:alpha/beta-hydrolase [Fistulina hepatica ATCC 64428]
MKLLQRTPFREAYLFVELLSLLVRIPVWWLFALLPSLRPVKTWSASQYLQIKWKSYKRRVGIRAGPASLDDRYRHLEGATGVWIEPAKDLIEGDLAKFAAICHVGTVRIPGYWLFEDGVGLKVETPSHPDERVVLHLHGGGFCRMSARLSDISTAIGRGLIAHCDSVHRVFSVEYRLSSAPPLQSRHPFPAAILDCLAGYNYLVRTAGFSPEQIIIEGNSAGGSLALALTRFLVKYRDDPDVPNPPGGLLVLSPWVDLGYSHSPAHSTPDYVQEDEDIDCCRRAYTGPLGIGAAQFNEYISPASRNPAVSVSFAGFPSTFIVAGGAEMLLSQVHTLRDKMRVDLGPGAVQYYEAEDGVHDYLVVPDFARQSSATLQGISKWVEGL